GWLAWVTQLFRDAVDADFIITNAAAYWLTGTIGSSIRRYYEDAHTTERPAGPTTTPTAIFSQDFQSIRKFADRDQRQHRELESLPVGEPFRHPRRDRPPHLRHPQFLPAAAVGVGPLVPRAACHCQNADEVAGPASFDGASDQL